jgi:hypothetical protein
VKRPYASFIPTVKGRKATQARGVFAAQWAGRLLRGALSSA